MATLNLEKITIRFSGDSGDGIQIIGNQISNSSVIKSGNEIFTFQEFPAEIRAPACSLSGISSFQISISNKKIYSIDDEIDILVALNPAAIKKNIRYLKNNSLIIIDSDSLNNKNFKRAGFKYNTLFYKYIKKFKILKIPITRLTYDSCKTDTVSVSQAKRSKNFFCLGVIFNIYNRKINIVFSWIKNKFQKNIAKSNIRAMIAGYNYVNNIEILKKKINVASFKTRKSKTYLISGNKAITLAVNKITKITNKKIFSASYPITPASDILHELIKQSNKKLVACQMEDEISAIGATIGASYGGSMAFTFTSGPGIDLMQESIGLAIMAEIPILIIDIQRSGPSTGMPTKSEQTDLMSSIFGSHGEGTPIVIAPNSPSDCFWSTIECLKIAEKLAHPVILLSDSNIATSSEIWEEPEDYSIIKEIDIIKRNSIIDWTIPGKYNHQKCIGGLERNLLSGGVSQDPNNQ
jgi:2-oxoglutarate ferredoxin oxidoreductase subunit alpha